MDNPFKVGEIFKNRRGTYEVVRLDVKQNNLLIRYVDSGEEFEAKLDIQARIWQNMSWEERDEARRKEIQEAQHQKGYGAIFQGLSLSDFKTNTEGTNWRSRGGLAGKVALYLSQDTPYTFVSWGIYRWPVAFLTHREDYQMAAFEMGSRKVKFTIEVDDIAVYFGLYIEKSSKEMDHTWDWLRLMPKLLNRPDLQQSIISAEEEHGIRFLARMYSGEETFHFSDGLRKGAVSLWDESTPSSIPLDGRLIRLNEIPNDQWGEIYLLGMMGKEKAVETGIDLGQVIADQMRTMLPVYSAAVRD